MAVTVGVSVADGVKLGVGDAKRAIAVSSIVGEAAIVGVWGASIFILHPANANTERANPIQISFMIQILLDFCAA